MLAKVVLVAEMPRLQREIVTELLRAQPGVETVVSRATAERIPREASRSRADVVVLGHDDQLAVRRLLEALPRVLVLTVADRELVAWRYGLAPYRERLGELSPTALAEAIHVTASLPAWWAP